MSNDFINKSNGMIVTEYCKKSETWNKYKDINYKPSDIFIEELVTSDMIGHDERIAGKSVKAENDISRITRIIERGEFYWTELSNIGNEKKLLTDRDIYFLNEAVSFARKGSIPSSRNGKIQSKTMSIVKEIENITDKLEAEGVKI